MASFRYALITLGSERCKPESGESCKQTAIIHVIVHLILKPVEGKHPVKSTNINAGELACYEIRTGQRYTD